MGTWIHYCHIRGLESDVLESGGGEGASKAGLFCVIQVSELWAKFRHRSGNLENVAVMRASPWIGEDVHIQNKRVPVLVHEGLCRVTNHAHQCSRVNPHLVHVALCFRSHWCLVLHCLPKHVAWGGTAERRQTKGPADVERESAQPIGRSCVVCTIRQRTGSLYELRESSQWAAPSRCVPLLLSRYNQGPST